MIVVRHHPLIFGMGLLLFFVNELVAFFVMLFLFMKYFCHYIIITDRGLEFGCFVRSNLFFNWSDIKHCTHIEWFRGVGVLEIHMNNGRVYSYYFIPYVELVSVVINLHRLMYDVYRTIDLHNSMDKRGKQ